jgi:hypothetical protein
MLAVWHKQGEDSATQVRTVHHHRELQDVARVLTASRPRPVPSALVVKHGVKIISSSSRATPGPLS